eukprot:10538359-Alexandrium_andersonii.AAC.1
MDAIGHAWTRADPREPGLGQHDLVHHCTPPPGSMPQHDTLATRCHSSGTVERCTAFHRFTLRGTTWHSMAQRRTARAAWRSMGLHGAARPSVVRQCIAWRS